MILIRTSNGPFIWLNIIFTRCSTAISIRLPQINLQLIRSYNSPKRTLLNHSFTEYSCNEFSWALRGSLIDIGQIRRSNSGWSIYTSLPYYIYIYIINQQDATLAVLFLLKTTSILYMFRTPFASIFRSTINCNSSHWCLSCCNLKSHV